MDCAITPLPGGAAGACEEILRSLPEWFGIEEAIASYRKEIATRETWIASRGGELAGFITVVMHFEHAAEILVMAVRRVHHRRGVGRALVEHVERLLRARGVEYLQAKTLGPSHPSDAYIRSRDFYRALGYRPLEEFKALWDHDNPCLLLVKRL